MVTAHGVGFWISAGADFSRYEFAKSTNIAKIATIERKSCVLCRFQANPVSSYS